MKLIPKYKMSDNLEFIEENDNDEDDDDDDGDDDDDNWFKSLYM